ncbi:hypothetical protein [Glutamicibacter endophyticus]|uniref:HNH endonuclease signature motif containing protein n=1 Tax=Glutamicibacter endophyticus TaxID=1522174 RepID=UPI003AF1AFB3
MQITDLARSLNDEATANLDPQQRAARHLHALKQITDYLHELPRLLAQNADPRVAALAALQIEQLEHEVVRNQIHAAHRVEVTAAHALPVATLDHLKSASATAPAADDSPKAKEPDLERMLDGPCALVPGRPTYQNATSFLAAWLRIEFFGAKARVEDAHRLIARPASAELPEQPRFIRLAEQFTSTPDPHGVLAAARRLEKVADDNESADLEEQTATLLGEEDPRTRADGLSKFFRRATDIQKATDPLVGTGLFRKGTKNGITTYVFKAAGEDSELLESLIANVDHPKTQAHASAVDSAKASVGPTGKAGQDELPHPDFLTDEEAASACAVDLSAPEPTVAQRRLAGLTNALRSQITGNSAGIAATGSGKPKGLFRPTVIVHMPLREMLALADRHGLELPEASGAGRLPTVGGITAHGLAIDPGTLRRMLCEANIIPMVLGGSSEILDVGRSQRYFPTAMKRAILARDRGCIVPGCTVPPEHCEVDHIQEWVNGGPTSVLNGASIHPGHHTDRHAGLFEIVVKDGLPWVRYPKHVDPEQRLWRNTINFEPK